MPAEARLRGPQAKTVAPAECATVFPLEEDRRRRGGLGACLRNDNDGLGLRTRIARGASDILAVLAQRRCQPR